MTGEIALAYSQELQRWVERFFSEPLVELQSKDPSMTQEQVTASVEKVLARIEK